MYDIDNRSSRLLNLWSQYPWMSQWYWIPTYKPDVHSSTLKRKQEHTSTSYQFSGLHVIIPFRSTLFFNRCVVRTSVFGRSHVRCCHECRGAQSRFDPASVAVGRFSFLNAGSWQLAVGILKNSGIFSQANKRREFLGRQFSAAFWWTFIYLRLGNLGNRFRIFWLFL